MNGIKVRIFFRGNNFYLQLARVYSLGFGFKLDLNCLGLVQIKICCFNNNLKGYTVKSHSLQLKVLML